MRYAPKRSKRDFRDFAAFTQRAIRDGCLGVWVSTPSASLPILILRDYTLLRDAYREFVRTREANSSGQAELDETRRDMWLLQSLAETGTTNQHLHALVTSVVFHYAEHEMAAARLRPDQVAAVQVVVSGHRAAEATITLAPVARATPA